MNSLATSNVYRVDGDWMSFTSSSNSLGGVAGAGLDVALSRAGINSDVGVETVLKWSDAGHAALSSLGPDGFIVGDQPLSNFLCFFLGIGEWEWC